MMTPNSFQQVVAADDLPARKALSELGSAPLPPVAELEAEYRHAGSEWGRAGCDVSDDSPTYIAMLTARERLATARRATGGNAKNQTPPPMA